MTIALNREYTLIQQTLFDSIPIAPFEGIYDSYKWGEIWLNLWLMLQARWGKMWLTMTHACIEGNYDFYIFLTSFTSLTSYWQLSLLKMWLVELAWASLMSQAKNHWICTVLLIHYKLYDKKITCLSKAWYGLKCFFS